MKPKRTQTSRKRKRLKFPPILLEGDASEPSSAGGTGRRYSLGPAPPAQRVAEADSPLPEAYGTRQLFLMARDPHWLFAHWDFSRRELQECNAQSADGHMVLRIYRDALKGQPVSQIHLHPQSLSWSVPVPDADAKYLAQLGYFDRAGKWVPQALSSSVRTPPDSASEDTSIRLATIAEELPLTQVEATAPAGVPKPFSLAQALEQLRASGLADLPVAQEASAQWTGTQAAVLAEAIALEEASKAGACPAEIAELAWHQLQQRVFFPSAAGKGLFFSPSFGGPSSPFGGGSPRRPFEFNIHGEVPIEGSQQFQAPGPGARV